ncbi:MAG TPA: ABC transporter substrate-binding protein/permease [Planctomycetota bacterium]|nr:ABC transporter substrate-binding protein/permease [Planctomycetota bacterium]
MLRLIACLLLTAAAIAQLPLPQRYRDAGVLRWGSDAEGGAPFVFLHPKQPDRGEIGFEVDLAQELGALFGVRMELVQTPDANLVQAVQRGDCDLAMNGLEPTEERRAHVRFTRPYYIFMQQLSVGPGVTGVRTLDDCKGRRVGVLGESLSQKLLEERGDVEVVVYESNVLAYQDVVNGRTYASLADLPIARALARGLAVVDLRPMFPELQDVGEPFHPFYYAIAVKQEAADLQQALDQALGVLFSNGTLERIYRKWDLWVDAEKRLGDADVIAASQGEGTNELQWGPSLRLLGQGALRTFLISVASFVLAVLLGLVVALARLHGPAPVRWCALAYVEVLRGTPILVQMLLLYYGLAEIGLNLDAVAAGILGLSLNYAAYEAEVYRGALSAIPREQREAALALGCTGAQTLRYVVVPQALRLSLAPSTNDFIALFKDSSILMVITVVELTKQYNMLAQSSGRFIALGLVTSALYLAMSLPLAWAARRFERRLDRDHA